LSLQLKYKIQFNSQYRYIRETSLEARSPVPSIAKKNLPVKKRFNFCTLSCPSRANQTRILSFIHNKSELFSIASDACNKVCVERPFHGTNLTSPRNRLSCPERQRVSRSGEEALHHIKHAVLIICGVNVSDTSKCKYLCVVKDLRFLE